MYYAQIDENNVVINVIVADDEFIKNMSGQWIKTDIEGKSPKNFAGVGSTWRPDLNGFIPPKQFPSWLLNEQQCLWEPPISMPPLQEGIGYAWNEDEKKWAIFTI